MELYKVLMHLSVKGTETSAQHKKLRICVNIRPHYYCSLSGPWNLPGLRDHRRPSCCLNKGSGLRLGWLANLTDFFSGSALSRGFWVQ